MGSSIAGWPDAGEPQRGEAAAGARPAAPLKRVFGSHDAPLVGFLASVLEEQGIACVVRNAYLGGAAGELPPTECWPEIWVADERDLARAEGLLREVLNEAAAPRPEWTCPACGERIEGQFGECWHCGASRPD